MGTLLICYVGGAVEDKVDNSYQVSPISLVKKLAWVNTQTCHVGLDYIRVCYDNGEW